MHTPHGRGRERETREYSESKYHTDWLRPYESFNFCGLNSYTFFASTSTVYIIFIANFHFISEVYYKIKTAECAKSQRTRERKIRHSTKKKKEKKPVQACCVCCSFFFSLNSKHSTLQRKWNRTFHEILVRKQRIYFVSVAFFSLCCCFKSMCNQRTKWNQINVENDFFPLLIHSVACSSLLIVSSKCSFVHLKAFVLNLMHNRLKMKMFSSNSYWEEKPDIY